MTDNIPISTLQRAEAFAPLSGVRVLDFSHVIAGPFATFLLAQMGADVTKVESADGDVMRRTARGRQGFVALNAGKRCIAIDLATAEGRAQAMALAAASDVVLDNLRPGVLERFGLGFEAVRKAHPAVVYCAISGFGRGSSEWRERPAYDHVVQAASGMAWLAGSEGDPPVKTGFPVVDSATGLVAAMAILAALRERDRTGCGLLVDVSMVGAGLQLMYPMACDALTSGATPPRVGNQGYSGSPAADFFPTADGGWLALGANTPRQLLAVLRTLGLGHLADDPAVFAEPLDGDAPAAFVRALDPAALKRALADAIAAQGAADLETRLNACRVPAARLRTVAEFAREARDNGCLPATELHGEDVTVQSPGLGFGVYRAA
jgi:crotonobetainyl-CoA:carnitine CoA-transferase CaiB-like acyl-CoA transferase